ncbi:hypothetical protein Tco_0978953 [Tanacetum coccineum]|uniref:Uncharacterized protein n=1 Tax=Tanacetum coccineum TaxID=301880 RepID=A0ABQ5EPF5_9ASTR
MKESKAYKTYLGHATGAVPPKIARKFKKASPSKKDSIPVQADEEPVQKGKRVKRSAKKSSTTPAAGIVFRETPVKTKSTGKEKVDVLRGKGIDLLSEVALAEKAQLKEITPNVTSEGTGDKLGVLDEIEDDFTESEFKSWGNDEDDSNNEQEASDEGSGQENESEEQESDSEQNEEFDDDNQEEEEVDQESKYEDVEIESDEDKGMDDTTDQIDDDVDARFEEPTQTVSPLDVHVHHEVPRTQAPTLLTIPVSVITKSSPVYTNIPQSSQTFNPPPILTTPTLPLTIESINPLSTLRDFALIFRFNDRITTLEKEVAKIKKDPLHTQVTSLVDEHLDTREEFMNFLSKSLMTRIKEQVKNQLPQILPKEVSNFAPPVIEKLFKDHILLDKMEKSESYLTALERRDCYDGLKKSYALDKDFFYSDDVYSLKHGRKDKDKDEDPSAGSDRRLKKRKLSKDAEPTTGLKKKDSTSGSSKGTKSQLKSSGKSIQSEEPVFEVTDSDMPQDQEGNLGDNEDEPRNKTASICDWFKKPTPPQEPTGLSPLSKEAQDLEPSFD